VSTDGAVEVSEAALVEAKEGGDEGGAVGELGKQSSILLSDCEAPASISEDSE